MAAFLRKFGLFVVGFLIAGALLNFLSDPTSYFLHKGWHPGNGGDRVYPVKAWFTRPLAVSAMNPETVILGSSRVGRGFAVTPESAIIPLQNGYNMGEAGLNMNEAAVLTDGLLRNSNLKKFYLALEVGMFGTRGSNRYQLQRFFADTDSTIDAIATSFRTYRSLLLSPLALDAFIAYTTSNVSKIDEHGNFSNQHLLDHAQVVGYRKLTRVREIADAHFTVDPDLYASDLLAFERVVTTLKDSPVELQVFINPIHVRQLLLKTLTGKKDYYLRGLDDISRIYCEHFSDPGQPQLTVFSGINVVTSAPFPAEGDTHSAMHGYIESSHFKPVTGERIMNRLQGKSLSATDDFGTTIDCQDRQAFLRQFRQDWENFEADNPELLAELSALVQASAPLSDQP